MSDSLLDIENLTVRFGSGSKAVTAVDDVSLTVGRGETVGLVGESGSGKSTIGRAIAGLTPVHAGRILFEGADITHLRGRARRPVVARLQMVFQDPYSSMNPSIPIGRVLEEPLHGLHWSRRDVERRIQEMLDRVGLPKDSASRYPGAFSGGQRQRIAIARALICGPSFVICDEATSALDLSIQAQVLNLLRDLQSEFDLAYLFIGHNLDVVRYMAPRFVVLSQGRVLERGTAEQIMTDPQHPYTRALVSAVLSPDPEVQRLRRAERAEAVRDAEPVAALPLTAS